MIAFCIIPILSLGLLSFYSANNMQASYLRQLEQENERVRSIMFDITSNTYRQAGRLVNDDQLINVLSDGVINQNEDWHKEITSILKEDASVDQITIYVNNSNIVDGQIVYCDDNICESDWYQKLEESRGALWKANKSDDNSYWLYLYRVIPLPLKKILQLSG